MKTIKSFNDFKNVNEGITFDFFKNIFNKFKEKFKNNAWQYILKYLKKNNKLPNGVEYFPSSPVVENYIKLPSYNKLFEDNATKYVELKHADKEISNKEADELINTIRRVYNFRNSTGKLAPLFIWGAPGGGKSEIVRQTGNELELDVLEINLSRIDPMTDWKGLPKTVTFIPKGEDEKIERTTNILPKIFPTSNGENGKGGILFLDEINRATKIVLSGALSLVLEGTLGEYTIPNKWIIIAAGNRKEDVFDVTEIEPALANRFQHVNYVPTVKKWTLWANDKKYIDPDLIAFLNFKPEYIHRLKEDEHSMSFPTPRSWSLASYLVYNESEDFKVSKNIKKEIYADNVGLKAAVVFIEFLDLKSIFNEQDIKNVYKEGKKAKKLPERLDQSNAVISAIAYYKKGKELTPDELESVLEYAINLDNFEIKTFLISSLKMAHTDKNSNCYLKEKSPWKEIWFKYIKEWYKEESSM